MLGLTLDGFRDGPKVSAAVDVPFCSAVGLGRKGMEPVLRVLIGVQMIALVAQMRMRMLLFLGAKGRIEDVSDLLLEGITDFLEEGHIGPR